MCILYDDINNILGAIFQSGDEEKEDGERQGVWVDDETEGGG